MIRDFFFPFLFLILFGLFITPNPVFSEYEQDLENAATFLQNQYNHTLHLCAEAPNAAPNTYWLWNDNYLAYEALRYYNETMANEILATLESHNFTKNNAYEALFNQTIELPFRAGNNFTVKEGAGYTIKLDIYNGTIMNDWKNYSNLLCLAALSKYWQRNHTAAIDNFNAAAVMWDGKGIIDAANPKLENNESMRYETYKLALLLYTEKILGQSLSFHEEAETIIWQMQNSTNYGIHTNYSSSKDPMDSDVNVETTSLIIGLYKWPEIYSIPIINLVYEVCNNFVGLIFVFVLIILKRLFLVEWW